MEVMCLLDADYILITQKEVNKEHSKLNKAVVMAYRYGLPFVSKKYILDAEATKECGDLNDYKLNLTKISSTPEAGWAEF